MKTEISPRQLVMLSIAVVGALVFSNYEHLLPYRWQTYTAPDAKFSVRLPGKANVETKPVPGDDGKTTSLTLIGVEPTRDTAYTCSYFDSESLGKKPPEQALEASMAGSLTKIQGTVISLQHITVQGYPGIDWHARARGNSLVDARMILVGNRLYMIMAVARADGDREPKTVQRVFESFKVLKP